LPFKIIWLLWKREVAFFVVTLFSSSKPLSNIITGGPASILRLACVAGSLVSQRSEAKKMADFDVCSRHFHDNWSVILTELPLTNRDPELQTTFSPPWFWQCF
jgi:hypothetical protein